MIFCIIRISFLPFKQLLMSIPKKMISIIGIYLPMVLLGFTLSCSKKDAESPSPALSQNNAINKAELLNRFKNLKVEFIQPKKEGTIKFSSSSNGGFTFAKPSEGFKFSDPSNGSTFSDPSTGASFSMSGSLASGGGTFQVGSKSVKLDYVFCASEDIKLNISDVKDSYSVLFGISGDFSSPEDVKLKYLVATVVTDENPNGTYDVIFSKDVKDGKKASWVVFYDLTDVDGGTGFDAIGNAKIYFSTDGSLSVSGGNINLDGIKMEEFTSEGKGDKVSASGTLSCE